MHTEARQNELMAAFERVENSDNWKNSIDANVTIENMDEQILIHDAVVHFTGSVPKFVHVEGKRFRVIAAGYYKTIGA